MGNLVSNGGSNGTKVNKPKTSEGLRGKQQDGKYIILVAPVL